MTLLQIKLSEDLSELYVNGDSVTYFDNTGVEYIPRKIKTICRQQKCHNKSL